MRLIPSAVAVPLLILLLTWLAVRAINPNVDLFDQALVDLDRFEMAEKFNAPLPPFQRLVYQHVAQQAARRGDAD